MFFSSKWNPDGLVCQFVIRSRRPLLTPLQHVYITGGSTGLGLSLATLLVKKGAHVSIVARNQNRLDKALAQLEVRRPMDKDHHPKSNPLPGSTCPTTTGPQGILFLPRHSQRLCRGPPCRMRTPWRLLPRCRLYLCRRIEANVLR